MSTAHRSPPTKRVVDVLEALAARSGMPATLTELATSLNLNKATTHNVLTQLVESGWLVREANDYYLGRGIVAVARAADASLIPATVIRRELERLAEVSGLLATAAAPVGDSVLLLDSVGPAGGEPLPVGLRTPFVPPTGILFVAWDESRAAKWLDQARPSFDRRVLEMVRRRGYSVERLSDASLYLRRLVAQLGSRAGSPELRSTVSGLIAELGTQEHTDDELASYSPLSVSTIGAPVFDAEGSVVLTVTLHPLDTLSKTQVDTYARECCAAAVHISASAVRPIVRKLGGDLA